MLLTFVAPIFSLVSMLSANAALASTTVGLQAAPPSRNQSLPQPLPQPQPKALPQPQSQPIPQPQPKALPQSQPKPLPQSKPEPQPQPLPQPRQPRSAWNPTRTADPGLEREDRGEEADYPRRQPNSHHNPGHGRGPAHGRDTGRPHHSGHSSYPNKMPRSSAAYGDARESKFETYDSPNVPSAPEPKRVNRRKPTGNPEHHPRTWQM